MKRKSQIRPKLKEIFRIEQIRVGSEDVWRAGNRTSYLVRNRTETFVQGLEIRIEVDDFNERFRGTHINIMKDLLRSWEGVVKSRSAAMGDTLYVGITKRTTSWGALHSLAEWLKSEGAPDNLGMAKIHVTPYKASGSILTHQRTNHIIIGLDAKETTLALYAILKFG